MTPHSKRLIQTNNALKRRWQRCTDEREKQQLKSELNRMQKRIGLCVKADFNASIKKQIGSFTKGSKNMWQLTKRIRGRTDNNATKIIIAEHQSIDDTDRANCVAKIFEKSHSITASFKHAIDTEVRNSVNSFQVFSSMYCQAPENRNR